MRGTSHTMWIIIAAVIAIVTLLLLTTFSGNIIGKTSEQSTSSIETSGGAVAYELCRQYCISCLKRNNNDRTKCPLVKGTMDCKTLSESEDNCPTDLGG